MKKDLALVYYNKGLNSERAEEKLFCFYDAFLFWYGVEEGVVKAAESCGVSTSYLKKAIDFANADSDSERVILSDCELKSMEKALQSILC